MLGALVRLAGAVALLLVSFLGISNTATESNWAIFWWLLFIFLALPVLLLAIRDCLATFIMQRSESFRAWLMLHVCAFFAAAVGIMLACMAHASSHPKAELHQWLILILPALVYIAPLLLALHSGSTEFLKILARSLTKNSDADKTD
ncbi:MAG: hypothetical protein EAZ37_11975 [Burkholderiales bacterium]|nr:MAG: hypothetical protein EAZ37_11975 [Burkholderiales bacterium]